MCAVSRGMKVLQIALELVVVLMEVTEVVDFGPYMAGVGYKTKVGLASNRGSVVPSGGEMGLL